MTERPTRHLQPCRAASGIYFVRVYCRVEVHTVTPSPGVERRVFVWEHERDLESRETLKGALEVCDNYLARVREEETQAWLQRRRSIETSENSAESAT